MPEGRKPGRQRLDKKCNHKLSNYSKDIETDINQKCQGCLPDHVKKKEFENAMSSSN